MKEADLEELKNQAVRHRQSGNSYISIGRYLESAKASPDQIKAVIDHIDHLEINKVIKPDDLKHGTSFGSGFIGTALIALGIIMGYSLWGMGWISTIPLLLISAGIYGLSGAMDR